MGTSCISTYKDKDKLFLVIYIYIDPERSKASIVQMFQNFVNRFENMYDETVNCIVFPVLKPEMQKIEILNVTQVNVNQLEQLAKSYKEFKQLIYNYNEEN